MGSSLHSTRVDQEDKKKTLKSLDSFHKLSLISGNNTNTDICLAGLDAALNVLSYDWDEISKHSY